MSTQIRISQSTQELLRCPICRAKLVQTEKSSACTNSEECGVLFPIVNGVPILLNEASSVFSINDFVSHKKIFFDDSRQSNLKRIVRRFIPSIGINIKARENYARLTELLFKQSHSPRVLVVGGGILGKGMEPLLSNESLELVESDVSFGPRTMLICDAHDIPFEDGSFDGVIVQAVLEHVANPSRCVEEIHRVLNEQGVVYAETPFIQQVHLGRYDFTRFTHLGHRRLFRRFEEIDSGASGGPGMALAWSYQYFLMSFSASRKFRALAEVFAGFTAFYLKYFDYYLINKPAALDAASGCYFLGRKSEQVLSDRDLIRLYKGGF